MGLIAFMPGGVEHFVHLIFHEVTSYILHFRKMIFPLVGEWERANLVVRTGRLFYNNIYLLFSLLG